MTLRVRVVNCCIALLVLSLCLYLSCLPRVTEEVTQPVSAAAVFRADRDALLERELSELDRMLADPDTPGELLVQAQSRRLDLLRWTDQEAVIEEVLSARGYECVTVSVRENSANIVVRAPSLSRQDASVILELVTRETGLSGGCVKIVPVN